MALYEELAEELRAAMADRSPVAPLTQRHPELDLDDAYAIQQALVAGVVADRGGEVVGWKLGLTSAAMQEMLGVDTPDHAPVPSALVHDDRADIALDELIQPRAEAEIALVLDQPLRGPGVTPDDVLAACAGARPAIEVIDSRIRDWDLTLVDTVADLASCGGVVLGDRVTPIDGWDPRLLGMAVTLRGRLAATGAGAAALGGPLEAAAWLANTLAGWDRGLQPGWFLLTGALHGAFDVEPGDEVLAEFDRLGEVSVRFI